MFQSKGGGRWSNNCGSRTVKENDNKLQTCLDLSLSVLNTGIPPAMLTCAHLGLKDKKTGIYHFKDCARFWVW